MTVSYTIIGHRVWIIMRPIWRKGYRPTTTMRPL